MDCGSMKVLMEACSLEDDQGGSPTKHDLAHAVSDIAVEIGILRYSVFLLVDIVQDRHGENDAYYDTLEAIREALQ